MVLRGILGNSEGNDDIGSNDGKSLGDCEGLTDRMKLGGVDGTSDGSVVRIELGNALGSIVGMSEG